MGGHEHNNMLVESGNAKIAKTDANAKTIYIHTFTFNKNELPENWFGIVSHWWQELPKSPP